MSSQIYHIIVYAVFFHLYNLFVKEECASGKGLRKGFYMQDDYFTLSLLDHGILHISSLRLCSCVTSAFMFIGLIGLVPIFGLGIGLLVIILENLLLERFRQFTLAS